MTNPETSYGDSLYAELCRRFDEEIRNPAIVEVAQKTLAEMQKLLNDQKNMEAIFLFWKFLSFLTNNDIKHPYKIVEEYTSQMMSLINTNHKE